MKAIDPPIVIEQSYVSEIGKVWNALTQVDQMVAWFFDNIPAFEAVKGFQTQFAVQVEDRTFTHCWEVTEVVPGKSITYTWRYQEYPGDATVTFDLKEEGENKTHLKLSLVVLKDFPEAIPEFARDSCIGGWQYFLGENLKAYLE